MYFQDSSDTKYVSELNNNLEQIKELSIKKNI